MTQDKIKRLHRCYGWILTAVLVVLGVALILSCLDIYLSGPRPYSAEAIAQRFWNIDSLVVRAVDGIIFGIIVSLLFPLKESRAKGTASPRTIMLRLRKKVSVPPCKKEAILRIILRVVVAHIFICLMIVPAIYFVVPDHFTIANLNTDVIHATIVTLIPILVGLALCWGCNALVNASYRREIAIYKQALIDGHRASEEHPPAQLKQAHHIIEHILPIVVKVAILLVAVTFIGIGILNGGAADVLKKAIAICTECIGLG